MQIGRKWREALDTKRRMDLMHKTIRQQNTTIQQYKVGLLTINRIVNDDRPDVLYHDLIAEVKDVSARYNNM